MTGYIVVCSYTFIVGLILSLNDGSSDKPDFRFEMHNLIA
jgi:hypothetical protein